MIEKQIFETILYLLGRGNEINEEVILEKFKDQFVVSIFKNLFHFKYLKELIEDPKIKEIIAHSPENIQIDKGSGLITKKTEVISLDTFKYSLEILAHRNNISWNFTEPYPSFFTKIGDGDFRATLVHPCTGGRAKLFLRRISRDVFKFCDFKIGSFGEDFLRERLSARDNIIVAGAAGSGKTSFIVSLLNQLPKNQHIVVLEDNQEIPKLSENFSFFLGQEGVSKKSLKDFYALSLRLRPDRIILGEMRSHEIIPLVLSLNTGHRGVLSTIHSDSAADALTKMAMLFNLYAKNPGFTFENSLKLICKNIDTVIYMKNREVVEVIRVIGSSQDGVLYENKMW